MKHGSGRKAAIVAVTPVLPTRIVKKPYWVVIGRGRPFMAYLCDDGKEYKAGELAAMIGIVSASFRNRILRFGWPSRKVLQTADFSRIQKKMETKKRQEKNNVFADGGNDEWSRLGMRSRPENFARIRPPGRWEQQEGSNGAD